MSGTCPCGSTRTYQDCCAQYHQQITIPQTAEQLMRSRYSAFVRRLPQYLLATLHPSKRRPDELAQLEQAVAHGHWLGLQIISSRAGQADDLEGFVAFRARYSEAGSPALLEENSRFIKEKERWYYVDGEFPPMPLPGRNDPCWCESGKKFKKCHG